MDMTTVAIGDIHGMYDMLDKLLSEIDAFAAQKPELGHSQLIFLGDYVDRGPDSRKVVKRLRVLEGPSVICLRGNHEQMMIDCHKKPEDWQNFLINGGDQTIRSYKGHEDQFEDDRLWMSTLKTSFEDGLRIFVHGGIKPGRSFTRQTDHDKMWIRDEFLEFSGAFPKYVVHGHTITSYFGLSEREPFVAENRCDIDTGAFCDHGALTAAFFNDEQAAPFQIISVNREQEVRMDPHANCVVKIHP
jgi:serine/threonine protein phosphatase 1